MRTSELRRAVEETNAQTDRILAFQREGDKRGFFPLPWEEGCWSASILVKNLRTETVRAGKEFLTCRGVEWGGLSYVLGEALFAWDRRICGGYFPFTGPEGHDHEHHFLAVLALAAGGGVEPEQPEQCYAPWMLRSLALLRQGDRDLLRRAVAWAGAGEESWESLRRRCPELAPPPLRCFAGGKERLCADMEDVLALAAFHPEDFTLCEADSLYSKSQQEDVRALLDYQRAALAGLAP